MQPERYSFKVFAQSIAMVMYDVTGDAAVHSAHLCRRPSHSLLCVLLLCLHALYNHSQPPGSAVHPNQAVAQLQLPQQLRHTLPALPTQAPSGYNSTE